MAARARELARHALNAPRQIKNSLQALGSSAAEQMPTYSPRCRTATAAVGEVRSRPMPFVWPPTFLLALPAPQKRLALPAPFDDVIKIGSRVRWNASGKRKLSKRRGHDDVGTVEFIKYWTDARPSVRVRFDCRPNDIGYIDDLELVRPDR